MVQKGIVGTRWLHLDIPTQLNRLTVDFNDHRHFGRIGLSLQRTDQDRVSILTQRRKAIGIGFLHGRSQVALSWPEDRRIKAFRQQLTRLLTRKIFGINQYLAARLVGDGCQCMNVAMGTNGVTRDRDPFIGNAINKLRKLFGVGEISVTDAVANVDNVSRHRSIAIKPGGCRRQTRYEIGRSKRRSLTKLL